jgi:hypothetical protein
MPNGQGLIGFRGYNPGQERQGGAYGQSLPMPLGMLQPPTSQRGLRGQIRPETMMARQQAMMQQAGGDPRRAMMMQMLQRPGGPQQGLLGRTLAARAQQAQQRISPRQALMQRRMGRMTGNRQILQKRLAAR